VAEQVVKSTGWQNCFPVCPPVLFVYCGVDSDTYANGSEADKACAGGNRTMVLITMWIILAVLNWRSAKVSLYPPIMMSGLFKS